MGSKSTASMKMMKSNLVSKKKAENKKKRVWTTKLVVATRREHLPTFPLGQHKVNRFFVWTFSHFYWDKHLPLTLSLPLFGIIINLVTGRWTDIDPHTHTHTQMQTRDAREIVINCQGKRLRNRKESLRKEMCCFRLHMV